MPGPKRPPAACASSATGHTTGDFERLLHQVSAEFEHLRQWNFELVRENSALRSSMRSTDGPRWPGSEWDGGTASSNLALARSEREPASRWGQELSEHLSPRAHGTLVTQDSSFVPIGKADCLGIREEASRTPASPASREDQVVTTQTRKELQEQFQRLDVNCMGRLGLEDLVRIMQMAEEPFEYNGLLNILRIFNGAEPHDFTGEGSCSQDDLMVQSEQMVIDFPAFVRLMECNNWHDWNIQASIRRLQRACQELERVHKVKTTDSDLEERERMRKRTAFWLETIPTIVILMNTLVTGLSADYDNLESVWDAFEMAFVAFYTVEFVVKVRLFGWSWHWLGPERWWNMFDFICLLLSLVDVAVKITVEIVWTSTSNDGKPDLTAFLMIKIFRLARLARLVRTLRFKLFHELKVMIVGVISGLRVLTWAIVLLVVMIYLVGVAMTNLFKRDELEFESVLKSMFTMFRCWTDGCEAYDGTPLPEKLREAYGFPFMVFHILMTMFVTVGVFNLIMAIFIDNVVTTQMMRKHKEMGERGHEVEQKFKKLFTNFIKNGALGRHHRLHESLYERARREFQTFGKEKTMMKGWTSMNLEWERLRNKHISITREAFKGWVEDEDFQKLLDEAEIETANHFELFDVLDADAGGELSLDELTTGLMQLRGPVTKADIVAVRLKVSHLTKILENHLPASTEKPISRRTEFSLKSRGKYSGR